MPCGCKKGHGISFRGAGVRKRKKGGMAIGGAGVRLTGAGYKKRRKGRRKKAKRRGGGWGVNALMYGPAMASLGSLAGAALGGVGKRTGVLARVKANFKRGKLKGGGGRFLSGAVWHGYGKGSGMSVSGAGLYGKRLLGRGGSGRRQI